MRAAPLELPVDTGVEAQSGMLDPSTVEAGNDTLENEPKIVHDASGRFSRPRPARRRLLRIRMW